jgi:hypothetical protein
VHALGSPRKVQFLCQRPENLKLPYFHINLP